MSISGRPAVEILARDSVREASRMARLAAEMIEQHAMNASLPAIEGSLKVLREATAMAINAYKEAAAAAQPGKDPANG